MEQVREIRQLKEKEEYLESIGKLKLDRLRNDASPALLAASVITGAVGVFLLLTAIFKRS